MKELKIILVCLLIGLPIFTVYRYTSYVGPEWNQQARIQTEIQQAVAPTIARQTMERAELWTGFYRGLMVAIIVGLFMAIGVLGWKQYDQRKESWARMVDGSFALQSFSNGQVKWSIDPNKQLTGTTGFMKGTGQLGEFNSAAGPDRQLVNNLAIQRTRTASATSGADGVRNSAQAKLAAGYYDRNELPVEQPKQIPTVEEREPYTPLSLVDAFNQSKPNRWLIGQNEQGVCQFNLSSVVHAAILGSSNSGKTSSSALLMAANARRQGINVIALDAAEGIDWNPYSNVFEVYATDHRVIGDQLNQIIKIHDQRKKACVLGGVKTIYDLDYTIPPIMVVLEEFGRLMQSFKNVDPDNYENIVVALTVLMSDSRKSGISFLFIDQGMQVWDKRFKTNIRNYIAYRMNAKQGAAFDAYDLHKLKPEGQFWNNGEIYNAWHTAPQFKVLQRELQPQRVKLLTDSSLAIPTENQQNGSRTVLDTDTQNSGFDVSNARTVLTGSLSASDGSSGSRTVLTEPPRTVLELAWVLDVYRKTGSKSATCKQVFGMKNGKNYGWLQEILQSKGLEN